MKKRITIFTILLATSQVWACSCFGDSTIQEELKRSDLVIVGTVISSQAVKIWSDTTWARSYYIQGIKDGEINSTTDYVEWKNAAFIFSIDLIDYTVIVKENLKGNISTDTIKVRTGFGHGDCGFSFEIGTQYLIYAEKEFKIKYSREKLGRSRKELQNIYRTNICWRTKPLIKANEEILEIKKN